MEVFKKITNSNVLDDIFDIPESMKNKKIVVTVSTYEDKDNDKLKDLRGALSKYKNEDLIKTEKDAWANSVVDRHENS